MYHFFEGLLPIIVLIELLFSILDIVYLLLYGSKPIFKILVDELYFNFIHSYFCILIGLVHINLHASAGDVLRFMLSEERGVTICSDECAKA